MTPQELSAARTFAEGLVKRSGDRIAAAQQQFTITKVGPSCDVTTDLDASNEMIMEDEIRKAYPDHAILGEEGGGTLTDKPTWILDPIDGTKYFTRNIPLYFSVVALQIGDDIAVGALYNPRTEELFSAARGLGATLNGVPLHAAEISDLAEAMVTVTNPSVENEGSNPDQFAQFERLARVVYRVRDFGHQNYSICLVGSGGLDAHVNIHGLKKGWWDAAAGICVALEAGAAARTLTGEPMTVRHSTEPFVVAAPGVVDAVIDVLKKENHA